VTWNAWIGNYIYGFNWVFRQDGSIEVITDLTGTLLCRGSASREGEGAVDDAAPLVGEAPRVPGSASGGSPDGLARVRAPVHQHFFSFRLDLDVDGLANAVATHDVVHTPMGDAGGFENVFAGVETLFASEGSSVADPTKARVGGAEHGRDERARRGDGLLHLAPELLRAALGAHVRAAPAGGVRQSSSG
jgi:primary-amine oxidase